MRVPVVYGPRQGRKVPEPSPVGSRSSQVSQGQYGGPFCPALMRSATNDETILRHGPFYARFQLHPCSARTVPGVLVTSN